MGFALVTLLAPSYGYSLFTYLLDKLYTQFIENVVRRMTKLCEISTFLVLLMVEIVSNGKRD